MWFEHIDRIVSYLRLQAGTVSCHVGNHPRIA